MIWDYNLIAMFLSYKECICKYQSDYLLEKKLAEKKIFKVEKGIYSDVEKWSEIALISYKYRGAVFTLDSAFYFQSLTDMIPKKYTLGTARNSTKITAPNIRQIFYPAETFLLGVEEIKFLKTPIKVYSKERSLIELVRNKNKLPFDLYKEVVNNFRNRAFDLNIEWLETNVKKFPASEKIMRTIQLEVF